MIRFEWDEDKNRINRKKHGIWFEETEAVFDDPCGRVFYDDNHSDEEDRFVIVGMNATGKLLVIVHCYSASGDMIRLISARKATRKEARFYEEGI